MKNVKLRSARRLNHARARGQSLPLIGLMIVVLVGMVGLSVDVGNTFQTERRAVAASNAAALAGMNVYIRRSNSTTHQSVYNAILNTLNSNGVQVAASGTPPTDGQLQLQAFFLDSQGKVLSDSGGIENSSKRVPSNVAFVQVNLEGRVGTYFARVVGRNDLPVNATSYAGTCPDGEGIYPIAVSNKILDGDKFANPGDADNDGVPDDGWRQITSGPYAGYTAMRMDVLGNASGNFSWLRWGDVKGATGAGANSAVELSASLTPPGNVMAHFEEADWPNNNKPAGYPEKPGQFNAGDWVHGSTGYQSRQDEIMDLHVREGTRMRLPIFTEVVGNGANAQYRVGDVGVFVVLSHGNGKGGSKYIEFVFLGRKINQQSACQYTAAPDPTQTFDLVGDVSIRPEYAAQAADQRPIQYVVVLDVSGSMSANFPGRCNVGPAGEALPAEGYWQCENGPNGALPQKQNVGPTYYWSNVNERRITVAKNAIESLVRSTNMPGNGGYNNARPDDQLALVWFDAYVNRSGNGSYLPFSNNPDAIISGVRQAGTWNNDSYRTEGGTNGAAGLYRAALALDSAPPQITVNGKTWKYKRVVIFITDGVSNQFLNKDASDLNGGQSLNGTYPAGHFCSTVQFVVSVASCQITGDGVTGGGKTTGIGGVAAGMDRPITQAGNVSRQDLQPKGVEVFAIALSPIPDTGLKDSIASFPNTHFFSADELQVVNGTTNVDKIMEAIRTKVEPGPCQPRTDAADGKPEFRSTIPADQFRSVGGLTYPQVGLVTIQNVENDTTFNIPIMADSAGKLTYFKSGVPKGTYKLTAKLFYKHPLENVVRTYGDVIVADQRLPDITVVVGPQGGNAGGMLQQVRQDLKLALQGDVCAAPTK
jgi:hypothetical protein